MNNFNQMKIFILFMSMVTMIACSIQENSQNTDWSVDPVVIEKVITQLQADGGPGQGERAARGVKQIAGLWRESDGDNAHFERFCLEQFIASPAELDAVFHRLAGHFENISGAMNRISLEITRPIHEDLGTLRPIDRMFGSFSPSAHLTDDFFQNKIAFAVALNFPAWSLEEKNRLGKTWSDKEWGYARLGDYFTSRVPSRLNQDYADVSNNADIYISEYNIFAGKLRNDQGEKLFPEDMKLLAHWNIRDEIKSNYGQPRGTEKQEMLYQVMLRIIQQDIPVEVINSSAVEWNPLTNELWKDGTLTEITPEGGVRYEHLKNTFTALKNMDPYYPEADTYIKRSFEQGMEIPREEVEALFREYASSPLLGQVAQLITERLERPLRPFDLWYDGFKSRSSISEQELNRITRARYPDAAAMQADLPNILSGLDFDSQQAQFLGSRIEVNAARGSGHAWGASMRSMPSHLRTRIGVDGMDYKGYNIAIHEFGHNVEQTISLHHVDNYLLNGVPNTAFTEALAFMFQSRDLQILGLAENNPSKKHLDVLDFFWNNFEMMGVSLVDMMTWEWMYNHPDASAGELKDAVISIANEVWNTYYAGIFGEKDVPLLAIYSHMISNPLYLSNYPYGRLIMFQLEEAIEGKNFADEVFRIFSIGRKTPMHWMNEATGEQISNQPMFNAVEKALDALKQ